MRAVHRRRLRRPSGARRRPREGGRTRRAPDRSGPRPRRTSSTTFRSRRPSGSRCSSSPPTATPSMVVPILEHDSAAAALGARRGPSRRLVGRHRRVRADRGAARPGRSLRHLGLDLGDAPARSPAEAPARSVHGDDARRSRCCARSRATTRSSGSRRPARRRTRRSSRSSTSASPGAPRTRSPPTWPRLLREHGHSQVDFTVVGSGPNGANPHHEAGDAHHRGTATWWCSTSAASRTATDRTPRAPSTSASRPRRSARCSRSCEQAQQAAFEAVAVGVACQEIDRVARRGDHGCRLRRPLHPPRRSRHRAHDARAAVHGRGRGASDRGRHVLLDRAGDLPARAVRRAHRGHRRRHGRRRTAAEQHEPRTAASSNRAAFRRPCAVRSASRSGASRRGRCRGRRSRRRRTRSRHPALPTRGTASPRRR